VLLRSAANSVPHPPPLLPSPPTVIANLRVNLRVIATKVTMLPLMAEPCTRAVLSAVPRLVLLGLMVMTPRSPNTKRVEFLGKWVSAYSLDGMINTFSGCIPGVPSVPPKQIASASNAFPCCGVTTK
jgi:hypothetical protein